MHKFPILMVNKKMILGLLVVLSLFIFACTEEQQEEVVPSGLPDDNDDEGYDLDDEEANGESEEPNGDEDNWQEEANGESEEIDDEDNGEELAEGITREEIAEHDNEDSCWVGYYGYVYDLTDWLNQHPGGADEILPNCGTVEEFTEAYDNRHGQKDTLNKNEAIAELV